MRLATLFALVELHGLWFALGAFGTTVVVWLAVVLTADRRR